MKTTIHCEMEQRGRTIIVSHEKEDYSDRYDTAFIEIDGKKLYLSDDAVNELSKACALVYDRVK